MAHPASCSPDSNTSALDRLREALTPLMHLQVGTRLHLPLNCNDMQSNYMVHQAAGRCKRGHLVLMAPLCTRGTSLSSTRRLASGCSALPPPAVTSVIFGCTLLSMTATCGPEHIESPPRGAMSCSRPKVAMATVSSAAIGFGHSQNASALNRRSVQVPGRRQQAAGSKQATAWHDSDGKGACAALKTRKGAPQAVYTYSARSPLP